MEKISFVLTLLLFLYFSISNSQITWVSCNGPSGSPVYSLAINSSRDIFAGTGGNGLYRSTDVGASWVQLANGVPNNVTVRALTINPGYYILAGTWGGIYKSIDNGGTWLSLNTGLTNPQIYSLAINSIGEVFACAYGQGVLRSTDAGNNWTLLSSGLTNTNVISIAVESTSNLFVATNGGGVFKSTNDGHDWTAANSGITNNYVQSISISPSGVLYAGTDGGGVFVSTDHGIGWTQQNNGLTDLHALCFTVNSTNKVFVGTNASGVFESTNNGSNWFSINDSLNNTMVRSLAIDSYDYIFAGTFGGAFRSDRTTPVVEVQQSIPAIFNLDQNYPNPFNPTTNIEFSVPQASVVSVKVYNVLGEEVANLVSDHLEPGTYKTEWNASGFASGVYFYRLEATSINDPTKTFTQVRKMILIR